MHIFGGDLEDHQQYTLGTMESCGVPAVAGLPPPAGEPQDSSGLSSKYLSGRVAVLWDIENCPVPGEVNAEDVAANVRMALRVHPAVKGSVAMFSAYGDFNHFPRRLREGCQRTGVNLIDVPNGKKDASDKAILVDMFLFALDNPPPCTIFLISGDVDFAPALHKLGQRGYTVVLAIPAGIGVSSALCNAGQYVWDWPSVARGEGLVSAKAFLSRNGEERPYSSDESDHQTQNFCQPDSSCKRGCSHVISAVSNASTSKCASMSASIQSYSPQKPTDVSLNVENPSPSWVEPGDMEGLKGQLVKLLKLNGGELVFVRVPSEYCKLFGRPLYLSDYGSPKLAHLIERMPDAFEIKWEGKQRMLRLKDTFQGQRHGRARARREMAVQAESAKVEVDNSGQGQDAEYIDCEEEILFLPHSGVWLDNDQKGMIDVDTQEHEVCHHAAAAGDYTSLEEYMAEVRLEVFRQELQELLVSHACMILLASFLTVYQQKYSRDLDLSSFGVEELESLFQKVQDVAFVKEEQGTKRKFLIARGRNA